MTWARARRRAAQPLLLRSHFCPGRRAHQAVDDDPVLGREPVLITRRLSETWPSVTYFCRTTFSPSTTSRYLRALLGADRGVATSNAW